MFPNASCELEYHNIFELLIAVVLSAQTTDKAVNKITPYLFAKYPTSTLLAKANVADVALIIKPIGLANAKSRNIISLSQALLDRFNGEVPCDFDSLLSLPGVGRKTANVVLSEGFHEQHIAVDTHVERVSKRLGLVSKNASVLDTELKLQQLIDESRWHEAHHLLIFFGRYFCTAKNPQCQNCFYQSKCRQNDKNSSNNNV
jgi:endonuclease-3